MKAYVISPTNTLDIASQILNPIKNLKWKLYNSTNSSQAIEEMKNSDIIIIFYNDYQILSISERMKLMTAIYAAHEIISITKKSFFTIALDGVSVPSILEQYNCFPLQSNNSQQIEKLSSLILELIKNQKKGYKIFLNPKFLVLLTGSEIFFSLLMILLITFQEFSIHFSDQLVLIFLVSIIFLIIYIIFLDNIKNHKNKENDDFYYLKLKNELKSNTKKLSSSNNWESDKTEPNNSESNNTEAMDALTIMCFNLQKIKEYYNHSQNQAKHSFRLAIIFCFSGLLLIALTIILFAFDTLSIPIAIIGIVYSGTVEFISVTILSIYKKTLSQLNYYHEALHENERFLSSVNLTSNITDEPMRNDVIKQIILAQTQINIIEAENRNKIDSKSKKQK